MVAGQLHTPAVNQNIQAMYMYMYMYIAAEFQGTSIRPGTVT